MSGTLILIKPLKREQVWKTETLKMSSGKRSQEFLGIRKDELTLVMPAYPQGQGQCCVSGGEVLQPVNAKKLRGYHKTSFLLL